MSVANTLSPKMLERSGDIFLAMRFFWFVFLSPQKNEQKLEMLQKIIISAVSKFEGCVPYEKSPLYELRFYFLCTDNGCRAKIFL